MSDQNTIRLNKVLRELNISLDRAVEFLAKKGHEVDARPTTKISEEVHQLLADEFAIDKSKKETSIEIGEEKRKEKEELRKEFEKSHREVTQRSQDIFRPGSEKLAGPKMVGKIDLEPKTESSSGA